MKYSKAMYWDLHTNVDGTFVTPIRYYDGKVCVLEDVTTMGIGDRQISTDTISVKPIYFVKGDRGSVAVLQGDKFW